MAGTSKQTSSSSFSASFRCWDVFLSFRGEDTRKTFVDHLYTALDRAGIQTFKDDPQLRKGEEISSKLLNAIQDSRVSIVVFSKNYASSRRCLKELKKILECKRTKGQTLYPVFYDVDPSDVRHQLGSFAEAIEKHKLRFTDELIEIWRDALTEASNLSGYNLKNDFDGHEAKLIQTIVKNVVLEVNSKALIIDEYLVGMDSNVEDLYEKISIGSSKLRVIGIHGMGGVGKTTIAKVFYNKYFHRFERSCFLENVREASQRHDGPLSLVEQLISELLEKQDFKVATVERGISFLKERVRTKKVLIVLDDLDQSSQLKLLVRYWNFFGTESSIIITTRDRRTLVEFEKIDEGYMVMPYLVKTLDKDESLELFSYHAFRRTILEDFREILERIVSYTGGLPLALKVLGSFCRTKEEWTSTLEQLQRIPNNEIQSILKISYDTLDYDEKKIFLDIAFFLVGMDKEEASHILDSSGFFSRIGIKVLEERCLLTIDRENKLRMHDLIREQSVKELGERNHLWCQNEACYMLKKQKGTKKIEGIRLDITTLGFEYFDTKTFESMPNLRLLQINNVHLTGSFENSFEELRWLCWRYCPLTCLPPSFHAPKLVSLDMQYSNVNTLWEGPKHLKSLKFLNASHSDYLTTTPDFGGVTMLEKLSLRRCSSLVQVHPSIGLLKKLVHLDLGGCNNLGRLPEQFRNMEGLQILDASNTSIERLPDSVGHMAWLVKLFLFNCRSLRSLPSSICNLSSLEELDLNGCSKLVGLPAELGNMKSLRRLNASDTAIGQLPDSVGHLSMLVSLELCDCKNLKNLPYSICNLSSLEELNLSGYSKLEGLPAELGYMKSLQSLSASNTAIEQLPDSVGHLSRLVSLELCDCQNLRNLPDSICNLSSLEELYLDRCTKLVGLPAELGNMKSLQILHASNTAIEKLPNSVGNLSRLISLNLFNCQSLINLPNSICNLSALEELYLDGCFELEGLPTELGNMKSLRWLPDSVGHLSKLVFLELCDCQNIRNLPNSICNLSSLEELNLDGCFELEGLPAELGNMKSLWRLNASRTAIEQLPDSIGRLSRLVSLDLCDCQNLRNLPNSICNLSSLEELYLDSCSKLVGLPADLGNMKSLQILYASNTAIEELPDSVGHLSRLVSLNLRDCQSLRNLPNSICNLSSLEELYVDGCFKLVGLPADLGNLKSSWSLKASHTAIKQLPYSSSSSCHWDVFLSFRGEDIRKTFVDHLYTALDQAGIQTFKDDPELPKGEEISPAFLNAIQDSSMSIVVFSKKYASSRWCLAELEKILECKRTKGQMVLPVFYDVDPSDVRYQRGSFAKAIEKHKLHFMDKVKIWQDALTEASNLFGYDLENDADGHESKLIQKIVKDVLLEVNAKVLTVDKPIGQEEKVTRHNAASELIHMPLHKFMLQRDLVAAETEKGLEITPVAGSETFSAMYETEILSNPAEIKETEIDGSNPDVGKEEGQMKSRLQSSFMASMLAVKPKIIRPISNRIEERSSKRGIDDNVLKIIGLLRNDTVRRIGIYGVGGIGKTTILKSVFNDKETNGMFDSIIWVTVSRQWSSKSIRDQIQMQLLNSLSGSNTSLYPTLLHSMRNKKILFLLDDVWDQIDLDDVGIPVSSDEIDCRIILTTRFLYVCRIMDADTELEIQPISREEAWGLFHDQVGGIIYSTDIKLYAETIVAECGGLPLAIVVTGRALREESNVSVWKHALRELLIPDTHAEHGNEAVIQQLKFSYDRLKARDAKDCFLYCASFQEDCEVNVSWLLNHLVDEGLVAGNVEHAFRRGNDIIQTLIAASMLESTDNGVSVKMHDVLRDFASTLMLPEAEGCHFLVRADFTLTQPVQSPKRYTFMTDKGHQFLFGAGAGSTEPPSNEKWEQAMMIFLMDNELFSLPASPSCPNLLSLFLQRNNHLRMIPESFFENMPCLEILNLSQTKIKSLPRSLFKLNNLKGLIIRDCKHLSILPSAIGALETLELLDLRGTAIYNLPDEVQSLTRLKHMTVSFYGSNDSSEYSKLPQTLVSNGILSRLVHLTVLHIAVYPGDPRWSKSIKSITMEIQNLKELEMLEIHFPEVDLLEQFLRGSQPWNDQRLTKFRFVVGHNVKRIVERVPYAVELDYNQQDRRLIFVNEETLPSAVKEVLSHSTAFYLDHHLNICKLLDFGAINLNALKFLILRECPQMQTVLNGEEVEGSAFPLLEHLSIHFLWSLEKICENPVPSGSFSKLRYLSIHTCPVLSYILPCSMAQNLHNLEVLIVGDCEAGKELIFKDKNIDPSEILLPKLKKLRLHYLPNLVGIWKGSWPPIEHISIYDCPSLTNLHMSFNVIGTIKDIKAEKEWWDELIWDDSKLFKQLQFCYTDLCDDDV